MDANVTARPLWPSRSRQLFHLAGRAGADRLFGYRRGAAVHRAPRPCPGCTHLAAASPVPADAHVHARRTWWTEVMGKTIVKAGRHEFGRARLRPMEPRHRQLRGLHPVRLQLLQAADEPGLAVVRRLQRVPGRAVRRDVRLSAEHLFPFGLAAVAISGHRLVLARRRTPARDDVRLEDEPALRSVSYFEFRVDRRRFRADRRGLARALRCPAPSYPRDKRTI